MNFSVFVKEYELMLQEIEEERKENEQRQMQIKQMRSRHGRR